MNKINSLLITAFLLTLSHTGFAAQADNDRYKEIVAAYVPETNSFKPGFVPKTGDIAAVADHKTKLEEERDSYKRSWVPTILKTIGVGFGIDAGISAIKAVISPLTYESKKEILDALLYPTMAIYPLFIARSELTNPITKQLRNEVDRIHNQTAWKTGTASIIAGTALFSAGIATYLFKKANSYQTEIERLEKEIEVDTNMINLLSR